MGMLETIFPGLNDWKGEGLPEWSESEEPWGIFNDEPGGLKSQILGISPNDQGIFIHENALIGEYVRIEGPCYIGERAEIRHAAYIRPGSWISPDAVVGHASEVKGSILLPGSKAPHFNYIGDSIVGFGVNLGAGVITANLRNDKRNVIINHGSKRIDSGTNKLGSLIGDGVSIGCNSVLNPGSLVFPGLSFPPISVISGENKILEMSSNG